jgi:hypothetical protein
MRGSEGCRGRINLLQFSEYARQFTKRNQSRVVRLGEPLRNDRGKLDQAAAVRPGV